MTLTVTYPHIEKSAHEPAHLGRVPRVRVAQIVMDYQTHGWSAEEMCRQHPYLRPAEVHAALAYYYDHRPEIEEEIASEARQAEEARRLAPLSPFRSRLKGQEER